MPFFLDPELNVGTTPLDDSWQVREHFNVDGGLPTCTYCGSIQPDAFIAAVKDGRAHGTDKSYKAYVDLPNPNAGQLRCSGGSYGTNVAPASLTITRDGAIEGQGWFHGPDLTDEQIALAKRDGMWASDHTQPGNWLYFGPDSAMAQAKFYLQHIAHQCPERAELYDLVMGGVSLEWYVKGMVGMRQEHVLRHPDQMSEAESKALEGLRERMPEAKVP